MRKYDVAVVVFSLVAAIGWQPALAKNPTPHFSSPEFERKIKTALGETGIRIESIATFFEADHPHKPPSEIDHQIDIVVREVNSVLSQPIRSKEDLARIVQASHVMALFLGSYNFLTKPFHAPKSKDHLPEFKLEKDSWKELHALYPKLEKRAMEAAHLRYRSRVDIPDGENSDYLMLFQNVQAISERNLSKNKELDELEAGLMRQRPIHVLYWQDRLRVAARLQVAKENGYRTQRFKDPRLWSRDQYRRMERALGESARKKHRMPGSELINLGANRVLPTLMVDSDHFFDFLKRIPIHSRSIQPWIGKLEELLVISEDCDENLNRIPVEARMAIGNALLSAFNNGALEYMDSISAVSILLALTRSHPRFQPSKIEAEEFLIEVLHKNYLSEATELAALWYGFSKELFEDVLAFTSEPGLARFFFQLHKVNIPDRDIALKNLKDAILAQPKRDHARLMNYYTDLGGSFTQKEIHHFVNSLNWNEPETHEELAWLMNDVNREPVLRELLKLYFQENGHVRRSWRRSRDNTTWIDNIEGLRKHFNSRRASDRFSAVLGVFQRNDREEEKAAKETDHNGVSIPESRSCKIACDEILKAIEEHFGGVDETVRAWNDYNRKRPEERIIGALLALEASQVCPDLAPYREAFRPRTWKQEMEEKRCSKMDASLRSLTAEIKEGLREVEGISMAQEETLEDAAEASRELENNELRSLRNTLHGRGSKSIYLMNYAALMHREVEHEFGSGDNDPTLLEIERWIAQHLKSARLLSRGKGGSIYNTYAIAATLNVLNDARPKSKKARQHLRKIKRDAEKLLLYAKSAGISFRYSPSHEGNDSDVSSAGRSMVAYNYYYDAYADKESRKAVIRAVDNYVKHFPSLGLHAMRKPVYLGIKNGHIHRANHSQEGQLAPYYYWGSVEYFAEATKDLLGDPYLSRPQREKIRRQRKLIWDDLIYRLRNPDLEDIHYGEAYLFLGLRATLKLIPEDELTLGVCREKPKSTPGTTDDP